MQHEEMMRSLRALRERGLSPKEIARALGMRPAVIASLVREIAAERIASAHETPLVGCWVTPGWRGSAWTSIPSGHAGRPPTTERLDWSASSSPASTESARSRRAASSWMSGAWASRTRWGRTSAIIAACARSSTRSPRLRVAAARGPIDLAQQLVLGAVEYARSLGLEPHPDFEPARGHLGHWDQVSTIRFGRAGQPFFVQGRTTIRLLGSN